MWQIIVIGFIDRLDSTLPKKLVIQVRTKAASIKHVIQHYFLEAKKDTAVS